ncbi:non-heme iron oxygenase ferredoxin subunit [Herbaspirillum sp. alder98]|uniref:non-heme iron oxygenase ferredoxin subunit n=1 Tax=Herbaspirillum sp. alder98 TaxID=2913096 RepID=UPI001CD82394|nr:non-heme iron oxygenase ferredoxin subunit [Herbaspirillum sp. alder98]MCA1326861.1 non-heme iron oxygenase ferredoxin subunit [Herbaspirillum sp. alder98]
MNASTQESAREWLPLGTLAEVFGTRACRSMSIENVLIGLFLVDGEIYAIDDICSHGNAKLSEGDVDGFEVECPLHAGLFDIRSGKALSAPVTRDVRSHGIRREGDLIFIQLRR